MAVSVVVTYYRNAETIDAALASVFGQSATPAEVLVVDDCSDPPAAEILAHWGSAIRIIRAPVNRGPGAARALGTREASGPWIAYLDADDAWLPTKLERQLAHLAENPDLDGAHCGTILWRNGIDGERYIHKAPYITPRNVCERENILPSAFIVRKDAILAIGNWGTNRRVLEDWDLVFRMMKAGKKIGFLPEALIRFRRDGHGHLTSDLWRDLAIHLSCVDEHAAFIRAQTSEAQVTKLRLHFFDRFARRTGGLPGRLMALAVTVLRHSYGLTSAPAASHEPDPEPDTQQVA